VPLEANDYRISGGGGRDTLFLGANDLALIPQPQPTLHSVRVSEFGIAQQARLQSIPTRSMLCCLPAKLPKI
jgi:hypothetical protein